jgi:hypothetical protein
MALGTVRERDLACLRTFVLYHGVLCYLFLRNAWWALLAVFVAEAIHSLLLWRLWPGARAKYWIDVAVSVVLVFAAVFLFVTTEWVFNGSVFVGDNVLRILLLSFLFAVLIIVRALLLIYGRNAAAIVTFIGILISAGLVAGVLTNQGFYADAHTLTIAFTYSAAALVTVTLPALGLGLYAYLIGAAVLTVILAIFNDNHSARPYSYYLTH